MPIYEYQCSECRHRLEALQKINDTPLLECPACGKPALKKLVSAAGFRLKGGGWYETDFKTGSKKHLVDSDSGDKGGPVDRGEATDKGRAGATVSESGKKTDQSAPGKDSAGKPGGTGSGNGRKAAGRVGQGS